MDFTGSRKYSGFSADWRFVSAAGDCAARRAMPTSGAGGIWSCGGGQSAIRLSRFPLHPPGAPWARAPASGLGFGSTGLKGRKETAGRRAGRRRMVKKGTEWGRTGDIAHLEAVPVFRFFFALSRAAVNWQRSLLPMRPGLADEALRRFFGVAIARPIGRSCRVDGFGPPCVSRLVALPSLLFLRSARFLSLAPRILALV